MDSWTLKKGYPVIHVDRITSPKLNTNLQLTQSWFLLNPFSKSLLNLSLYDNHKWYVPFTYTTKSSLNFEFERKPFWLKPNESECNIYCWIYILY